MHVKGPALRIFWYSGTSVSNTPEDAAGRKVLALATGLVAVLLAGQFVTMLVCRHEFQQVESIVAMQSSMLARGEGIYYDLQHYPFTVSAYGPVFYTLSAGLYRLGVPAPLGGRCLSFAALLGILVLVWRLLRLETSNRFAAWTGMLLIASSPMLMAWGTTGHVDVLGLFFSLAALYAYSVFRSGGGTHCLALAAVCLALAVFTKQTMVASGAAITILLFLENRKRAAVFAGATAGTVVVLALLLNHATGGRYFDNAILGNLNPFSAHKAVQQAQGLLSGAGCLMVLAAAGLGRAMRGRLHPFYVYAGCAAAVLAVTAPKVGSDLNYQMELIIALGLSAAWALDQLGFGPEWFRSGLEGAALLGILPVLQLLLNLMLGSTYMLERWVHEGVRRDEMAQLQPYLRPASGRVLSVAMDPLLHARGRLDVEPLIYTLLVNSGRVRPEPVERDLAGGRFALVLLFQDVFDASAAPLDREIPSLPETHLRAIRERYRLAAHIPGPYQNGDYLYVPR